MRKIVIMFIGIFLYADISNILLKIYGIENFHRSFIKINLPDCERTFSKKDNFIGEIKKSDNKLILNAIFNNKALINNKWVKAGDFFNSYQVMKILSKQVILKRNNRIIVLKFNQSVIKVKK